MRLRSSEIALAAEPVSILFDGVPISAIPGETIAAALTAAGIKRQRYTQKGSPRGLFCGMGVCYDCLVTVDGKASQRACLTTVHAEMVVTSQSHGLVEAGAEGVSLADTPDTQPPQQDCEILVVGAGPGGLAAACAAAHAGAAVTIVDERPYPGGQYFKPLAPSQRIVPGKKTDAQFAAGHALTEQARASGVLLLAETTVWGGVRDERGQIEIGIIQNGSARIIRPKQLIIATGAYERPLPVPGWTLPGVITTGAAQTLARGYRVAPGERILLAGNGPLNLQVACELIRGGAKVLAVAEAAPAPWLRPASAFRAGIHSPRLITQGLTYLATLRRHGIAVLYQHVLTGIDGVERAEKVTVGRLHADGAVQTGTERCFDVDTVCMGYGFLPSTELARQLGCRHSCSDIGIGNLICDRDEAGKTSVDDIYVVGEAGAIGGAQVALSQGGLAGEQAAGALGYSGPRRRSQQIRRRLRRQKMFQQALWTLYESPRLTLQFAAEDTLLCRCEEVTLADLRTRIANGTRSLGALKRQTRAGMGRCQGRYCAPLISRLVTEVTGHPPQAMDFFAPQLPLKPVPGAALAVEKPEWGGHKRSLLNHYETTMCTGEESLETDVLVIGAGIAGCSTAYFLASAGCQVRLVERGEANAQASGANAGSLHVQLLSFDHGHKAEAGGGPAAATLPLQKASVALWRKLESALNADFGTRIGGGLMVAETARDLAFLKAKIAVERAYGIDVELIGKNELRELAPAVSEHMIGAAFCPLEGKIDPLTATTAILQGAINAGAELSLHTQVNAIAAQRPGFSVQTNRGVIHCRRIVNAAGPWAGRIAAMLGVDLPVHAAPLQMIVTEPAAPLLDVLIAHADRHLTLKQVANGNLIIGGGWTAALNQHTGLPQVLRHSIEGNLWVAQRVIPALRRLHILRSWAAMNVNIDGAPVLGEVPGKAGFYNVVSSNGYTLGPILGQLTAQLITDGYADRDLSPFSIDRFVVA